MKRLLLQLLAYALSICIALAAGPVSTIPYPQDPSGRTAQINQWIVNQLNPALASGSAAIVPLLPEPGDPSIPIPSVNVWIVGYLNPSLISASAVATPLIPNPPDPSQTISEVNQWIVSYLNPSLANINSTQPGFLPAASCTGNFVLNNYVPNSNDFVPADGFWSVGNNVAPATTVSNVTDILPDGTSGTVSKAIIGATTSGTTQYSAIYYNDTHDFAQYPLAYPLYAKIVSGAGSVYDMIVEGTTFSSVVVPNDNAWHLVTVPWTGGGGNSNVTLEMGINQIDPTQVRTANPTMTVEFSGAYFGSSANASVVTYSDVKAGGALAVTSSPPLQAQVTKHCPPNVAQRDIATWSVVANPAVQGNPANIYEAGGLAAGSISAQFQSGGKYWGFSAQCYGTMGNIQYFGSCLQSSTNGLQFTDDTSGNNPQLVPTGAVYAYPNISNGGTGFTGTTGIATYTGTGCSIPPVINVTVSGGVITAVSNTGTAPLGVGNCYPSWPGAGNTAWSYSGGVSGGSGASFVFVNKVGTQSSGGGPVRWTLHPSFYPYGCSDGTNPHNFCVVYSGVDVSNAGHLYTAWSDTVNGVYTPLGCAGPGPCATATPLPFTNLPVVGEYINPGTPQVINVGGINGTNYIYAYAGHNFDSGVNYPIFATDANPAHTASGTTLALVQDAGFTIDVGLDWYAPVTGTTLLDVAVFKNHCNSMYELYFVVESTNQQVPPWQVTGSGVQIMGGAVSNSPLGPWYQKNAPVVVPFTGNPNANTGDPIALEIGGNFQLLSTYNVSGGIGGSFAISGPQGSCP